MNTIKSIWDWCWKRREYRGKLLGRKVELVWPPTLEITLINFAERCDGDWSLNFFGQYIKLNWKPKPLINEDELLDSWGFHVNFADRHLHLVWGNKSKFIDFPWSLSYVKSHVLTSNGWKRSESTYNDPDRKIQIFPYTYVLESGEVQNRTAEVHIDKMEWRWKWFKWWAFWPCVLIRECINVNFNDEVGERSGSWKGGCTGCSYELKKGETAEECLRRMEKERKF